MSSRRRFWLLVAGVAAIVVTLSAVIRVRFSRVLEAYRDDGVADIRRSDSSRVRRAR